MKRKFLVPVLILGLVFLVGVSTLAVESKNEPVNNAAQFQRAETGPGVYCGECDGEPENLQRQFQESRRLENGENGEYRQDQKRAQRMRAGN
ncbi:hypothetical protein I0Q91_08475 [Halanaerobiaceae bacterium Z-7014]|uniref:Uncharacterized protein n=1 Tax=Halonatronomonas betaini TaxID=2778430 RepID=A0A931AUW2_9FIRM|nr:hypothetical protein [Halonatronomonas betaini]MBF8437109.1 hypothetical protein [Halonatronomonas betaini]